MEASYLCETGFQTVAPANKLSQRDVSGAKYDIQGSGVISKSLPILRESPEINLT